MTATLNTLIEKRNSLRAERADLLEKLNAWELAGRNTASLEADYEAVMVQLRAVNAEINSYRD